jgi:predicted TIM-barrel fold metal-dependent hydrolase
MTVPRYTDRDAAFYDDELRDFLPHRIIDCHTHIGLAEHTGHLSEQRRREMWALDVAQELTVEALNDWNARLLPGHETAACAFGWPIRECNLDDSNAYVARSAPKLRAAFLVTDPHWPAERVRDLVLEGGFTGLKPYPDLADAPAGEASVPEFLPESHQALAESLGLVIMLHLPRKERLRDPRNLAEVRTLAQTHPTVPIIVAHIGRAYTMSFAEGSLRQLADLPSVHFDFAANLNAEVIALCLGEVGPSRLLYGSDLPIGLMRGMREHRGDQYINYTDGDYLWNTDRKAPEVEAGYTLFIYEQLRAFRLATESVGLTESDLVSVFSGNIERLLPR